MTDDNRPRYWIAIKGAAAPAWPTPVRPSEMRNAVVHVGQLEGELTLWGLKGFNQEEGIAGQLSNYDVLIGYRTLKDQRIAAETLLNGSIEEAHQEVRRAATEEIIIRGHPS